MNVSSVTGQCYCGAIRFELTFPTEFCSHCHCEDCRRTHGAPFVTWTGLPLKQFKFISGENKVKKYESHPGIRWSFCADCGTSLLYDYDIAPEKIYVTVANLNGPLDREPDAHVSFEERPDWMHRSETLPRFKAKTDEVIKSPASGKLHHVEYYVNDLERTREFWTWLFGILGWKPRETWKHGFDWFDPDTRAYLVFVQVKEEHLRFQNNRQAQGLNHIAITINPKHSQATLAQELQQRGATIIYDEPNYLCFEDPSQIVVELYLEGLGA